MPAVTAAAGVIRASGKRHKPPPPSPLQKGPCRLCGAKVATSWRRLPSTVPQAAGTMACETALEAGGTAWCLQLHLQTSAPLSLAVLLLPSRGQPSAIPLGPAGNPCFVYLSKRAKDEPEALDEALALCRAAKRPCRSHTNTQASSGSEVSRGQVVGTNC